MFNSPLQKLLLIASDEQKIEKKEKKEVTDGESVSEKSTTKVSFNRFPRQATFPMPNRNGLVGALTESFETQVSKFTLAK